MEMIQNASCVRFIPRISQHDYVVFKVNQSHCGSQVGKQGGPQIVTTNKYKIFLI